MPESFVAMPTIFHITTRTDWSKALGKGTYEADTLKSQGFMHCSKPDQVQAIGNRLFRGQSDLVLLCIDPERVTADFRYEHAEGCGEVFPHIYGALNMDAVTAVIDFVPGVDGTFPHPDKLGNSRTVESEHDG
jgi:uncharacterized protein (DUF952 family)